MIGSPDATPDQRPNAPQPGEAGVTPTDQLVIHPKKPVPRIAFASPPRRCKSQKSFARPCKPQHRITQFFPHQRFARTAECAPLGGTIAGPVPPTPGPRLPGSPDRLRALP